MSKRGRRGLEGKGSGENSSYSECTVGATETQVSRATLARLLAGIRLSNAANRIDLNLSGGESFAHRPAIVHVGINNAKMPARSPDGARKFPEEQRGSREAALP